MSQLNDVARQLAQRATDMTSQQAAMELPLPGQHLCQVSRPSEVASTDPLSSPQHPVESPLRACTSASQSSFGFDAPAPSLLRQSRGASNAGRSMSSVPASVRGSLPAHSSTHTDAQAATSVASVSQPDSASGSDIMLAAARRVPTHSLAHWLEADGVQSCDGSASPDHVLFDHSAAGAERSGRPLCAALPSSCSAAQDSAQAQPVAEAIRGQRAPADRGCARAPERRPLAICPLSSQQDAALAAGVGAHAHHAELAQRVHRRMWPRLALWRHRRRTAGMEAPQPVAETGRNLQAISSFSYRTRAGSGRRSAAGGRDASSEESERPPPVSAAAADATATVSSGAGGVAPAGPPSQGASGPHPHLYRSFPHLVCQAHVTPQHWQRHLQLAEASELAPFWAVPVLATHTLRRPPPQPGMGAPVPRQGLRIPVHGSLHATACHTEVQTLQMSTLASLRRLCLREGDMGLVDTAARHSGFESACQAEPCNELQQAGAGRSCQRMQAYMHQVCCAAAVNDICAVEGLAVRYLIVPHAHGVPCTPCPAGAMLQADVHAACRH